MTSSIYFVWAPSARLIKIGISATSTLEARVHNIRMGSPAQIQLEAHAPGDALTEAELHWRFRNSRSHGEWFHETPELWAVIAETERSGQIPGAFRFPESWDDFKTRPLGWLFEMTGLGTNDQLAEASGLSVAIVRQARLEGARSTSIPKILEFLRDHGIDVPLTVLFSGEPTAA